MERCAVAMGVADVRPASRRWSFEHDQGPISPLARLSVLALSERDYPVVSGINLLFATAVVAINLMIDLIYPYLDPRVRYE